MADVIVGSRTHGLRVFTGSTKDAREFAAGLVEQLGDQGPGSPSPGVGTLWQWTSENWRKAQDETALNFRQGLSSCLWSGPAGLEIRIEDARTGVSAEIEDDNEPEPLADWEIELLRGQEHGETSTGVSAEGDGQ